MSTHRPDHDHRRVPECSGEHPILTVQNGYDDHSHAEESWTLPPIVGDHGRPLRFGRRPGSRHDLNIEIGPAFPRHMGSFVFDRGLWWLVLPIHDPDVENSPTPPVTVRYLNRATTATVSEGGWLPLGTGDQGRIDFISAEPNQVGWLEFTVSEPGQDIKAATAPPAVEEERLDRRHLDRGLAIASWDSSNQGGLTVRPVGMSPSDRQALVVASWFAWDDPFGPFLTPRQTAWILKDLADDDPGKRWADATDDEAREAYLARRTNLTSDSLRKSVDKWARKMDREMAKQGIEARMTTWPNLPSWRTSKRYTIQWLRAWAVLRDLDRASVIDKLGGPPYGGTYPGTGVAGERG